MDRSNVKLLIDFYHLSVENENPNIIIEAGDYLKHIHFVKVEGEGRVFPKKLDEDNYRPFIDNLKKIDYKGRVSIEAYSKDFYNDALLALKFLK